MIVQALKQVGMSFGAFRAKPSPSPQAFFEVQLVGEVGVAPLSITTARPREVAHELMRDRDPRRWNVQIRPLGRAN